MSVPRFALDHPQVLLVMQQCRYTTLSQLRRAFPPLFSNQRTDRDRLQRLRDADLIKTVSYPSDNVHSVTANGIDFLAQRYGSLTNSPDEGRTIFKLEHELVITDLQLDLMHYVQQHPHLSFAGLERRFSTQLPYHNRYGKQRYVQPDLAATLYRRRPDGSLTALWLPFEVDLGNEKTDYFQAKQDAYDSWFQQGGADQLWELYADLGYPEASPVYHRAIVTRHRSGADDRQLARLFTTSLVSTHQDIYHAKLVDLEADRQNNIPLTSPTWYAVKWFGRRRREKIRQLFRASTHHRSALYAEVAAFLNSRRQRTSLL